MDFGNVQDWLEIFSQTVVRQVEKFQAIFQSTQRAGCDGEQVIIGEIQCPQLQASSTEQFRGQALIADVPEGRHEERHVGWHRWEKLEGHLVTVEEIGTGGSIFLQP
jgi:hypothetical protein